MSESGNTFESWEEVIVDFFKRKREADEEKYLKDIIKSVETLYEKEKFFNDEEIELVFDSRKNKKEKNESSLDFQRRRAVILLKAKKPEQLNNFKYLRLYKKAIALFKEKYDPKNWISKNCENASSVNFATHVIKLTHSSIDASSFYDSISEQKNSVLTTSSLKNKIVDGAVKGNQFAPIFQFLELELNGVKLAEKLSSDNHLFDCFEDDEKDKIAVSTWINGFRGALDTGKLSSSALAKQIYFPTEYNQELLGHSYHILCNIISSSLAQTIHEKIFDERDKYTKKSLETNKYFSEISYKYINRSQLGVTASNHSNASQLNAKRGGKLHLFSNRPPLWQSQIKPPLFKKSLFSDLHNSTIKIEMEYLRDFLIRFKQLDLSIKDPKRKRHLDRWVNNIIDEFLFYVGTIQNLPSGWSSDAETKLKKSHQYLLDPYRLDEAFQSERQNQDWQAIICADFTRWLNSQLIGKDRQFSPQAEHTRLWKIMLEQPLREYMEPVEQQIKQRTREIV